jgi:hypothetical protein
MIDGSVSTNVMAVNCCRGDDDGEAVGEISLGELDGLVAGDTLQLRGDEFERAALVGVNHTSEGFLL